MTDFVISIFLLIIGAALVSTILPDFGREFLSFATSQPLVVVGFFIMALSVAVVHRKIAEQTKGKTRGS